MTLCHLIVYLLVFRHHVQSQDQLLSHTLTPSNPSTSDARVIIQSSLEVLQSDTWAIDASNSDTWHLKAELGQTWGFHPIITSTISITIDSPTNPGSTFDDVLIAFTVPHSDQFTAVRLYMDNYGSAFEPETVARITPQCDTASLPSQHLREGDLDHILEEHRERKCALGLSTYNCVNADNHGEMEPSGQSNSWPITFTLVNVPEENRAYISYQGAIVQSCGFSNGFAADQGLNVYFALGRPGDFAEISSFQFTYSLASTSMPTAKPTIEPTPRSGEIVDDDLTTTSEIDGLAPIENDHVASTWSQWVDGPYFIPTAVALGSGAYTLCTLIVCCFLRKRKRQRKKLAMHYPVASTTSSVPKQHSVHSTMSMVSDARSVMSTCSIPQTGTLLTHSAYSTSGHLVFEAPMLWNRASSGMIPPPLADVNEQVI